MHFYWGECPWNFLDNTGVPVSYIPVHVPNPGIEPAPLTSPELLGGFFTNVPAGQPSVENSMWENLEVF